MSHDHSEHEEKMILDHEPAKGFLPVFLVAITIGILYLGFVFFRTL